jgi:hypothetical protein
MGPGVLMCLDPHETGTSATLAAPAKRGFYGNSCGFQRTQRRKLMIVIDWLLLAIAQSIAETSPSVWEPKIYKTLAAKH